MKPFETLLADLIAKAHGDGEDELAYDSNETIAARRALIDWAKNELGFCEEHDTLNYVMDSWCLKCNEEYDNKRKNKKE
jgi:hypothetical protein